MTTRRASPFSPRVALGLVIFAVLAFVALLWMIGSGMDQGEPRASGSHAQGKGLNGYAALYSYLEKRGFAVSTARTQGAMQRPGVLVLTPLHSADPEELQAAVDAHRGLGPTVLILPKWLAAPLRPGQNKQIKDGFVELVHPLAPEWKGFYDDVALKGGALETGPRPGGWDAQGLSGRMPEPRFVFSGDGEYVIPLVMGSGTEQILAGYISDGGLYPRLREITVGYDEADLEDEPTGDYPVIMVFDADLFNNYGMARPESAVLAEKLINAARNGGEKAVIFDMTLAGHGSSQSLLTLAFTPPFLAATLCLILAGAVVLWRTYRRFGPPVLDGPAIAYGKRALVASAAGLVQRARRLHLLGPPYADAARERLVRALALPARLGPDQAEAAIDRALAARTPDSPPFSETAATLRAARKPADLLRAARQLHAIERTLTR
ncbi:MAG: DUF4350 domain-containing protein [Sphingomonadales bacterium]|nr:DUF4350 domain-containing protein [Sphingomonadales bacterium]